MPTLSIHIKTTGAGLIKEPCILISYYNEDWGVLQRMLNHRNIEKQFVLKRFATNVQGLAFVVEFEKRQARKCC